MPPRRRGIGILKTPASDRFEAIDRPTVLETQKEQPGRVGNRTRDDTHLGAPFETSTNYVRVLVFEEWVGKQVIQVCVVTAHHEREIFFLYLYVVVTYQEPQIDRISASARKRRPLGGAGRSEARFPKALSPERGADGPGFCVPVPGLKPASNEPFVPPGTFTPPGITIPPLSPVSGAPLVAPQHVHTAGNNQAGRWLTRRAGVLFVACVERGAVLGDPLFSPCQ